MRLLMVYRNAFQSDNVRTTMIRSDDKKFFYNEIRKEYSE